MEASQRDWKPPRGNNNAELQPRARMQGLPNKQEIKHTRQGMQMGLEQEQEQAKGIPRFNLKLRNREKSFCSMQRCGTE